MNGSKHINDIVRKANRYHLFGTDSVMNIFYKGRGDYAVKRYNIVLLAGSHARGTTAHIYLEDGDDRLEVYGIVSGQPGWTEEYGWIRSGSWCSKIEKLINELEIEIRDVEELNYRKKIALGKTEAEMERQKLQKFEMLFSK